MGKEKKKEERKKGRDPKIREKDLFGRWEDLFAKQRTGKRVAARLRGWERKNTRGNPRV